MTANLLLEIALKSTVVLLLASFTAAFMTRTSAATRHLVWTAAFIAILILPLLIIVGPKWTVATVPEEWSVQPPVASHTATIATESRTVSTPDNVDVPGGIQHSTPALDNRFRVSEIQLAPLLIDLVLSGIVIMTLKLVLGVIWAAHVRSQAVEIVESEWTESLCAAAAALKMKPSVRVLKSDRTSIACTSGVLRPRVLVPMQAEEWAPARRRVVLLHELGHVKRHDCLIQTLSRTAAALYWFNPLAHFAAARMLREQEQACDDLVLSTGTPAANYADELIEIARAFRRRSLTDGLTLAMARPSHLMARITAILDQRRQRHAPSRAAYVGILLIVCLGIIPLGTAGFAASSLSSDLPAVLQPPAPVEITSIPAITIKEKSKTVQAIPSRKPACGSVVACEAAFASTDPDLVFVNASVSNAQDRLVTGLRAENFQIWEDKVAQTIEYFSEALPLTLGLITGNMPSRVAADLETLVRAGGGADKYFLVQMAPRRTALEEDFTTDPSRLQNHTTDLTNENGLPVFDTIYLGLEKIRSGTGRKALLIITDREDSSRYTVENVKALARQQDVQIFVIGIQATAAMRASIEDLVSVNSGRAFFPDSENELSDILQKIGIELRSQYMLGYHPTNKSLDGDWRKIAVKVVRPSELGILTVRSRSGYFASPGIPNPPIAPLKFEVVSIKRNNSGIPPSSMGVGPVGPASGPMGCRGTDRGPQAIPLGRCIFKNVTAGFLLSVVSVLDEKEYRVGDLPDWVTTEGYDIEGKSEVPVTQKQLGEMLVSLLVESFHCSFRLETKEVSGFALSVAQRGSRFSKAGNQDAQSRREDAASIALLDAETKRAAPPSGLSPARMVMMTGNKTDMRTFAEQVSRFWTGPVVDRTGLDGYYDFELRWQPDNLTTSTVERLGPSFTTALEEQLGLRLQPQKVPVEFLMVDHIDKPVLK